MTLDLNLEEIMRWHAEGVSNREIARRLQVDEKQIRMRVNRLLRTTVGATAPLTDVVPAGFHLSSVSTTVDADKKIRSQSYKAKSGDEGDVVPESGAFAPPDGLYTNAVSTLIDGQTGAIKQQWVKSKLDENRRRLMLEAMAQAMVEKLEPLPPTPMPDIGKDEQLLNLYTLTDSHVGMLAWSRETGEQWDLEIAEDLIVKTFTLMIDASPAAAVGIVNQLGDFLHFDSLIPQTPTSHNALDADSRYQKVVKVAVRILRRVIAHALTKHAIVYVYMHEGNHDMAGSVWLRIMFAALYENEPRVVVGESPLPYVAYQHGKTMIGFHHGHLAKKDSLPLLFAARFSKMWGETLKRYIHTGHLHHVDEKEHPGVKVQQHPTIAANDAYGARAGFLSERQATCVTYHKEFGEVARFMIVPEMVGYESRRRDL
jgi:hypothetical protein